ncbi:MAG: non-canonical purine NTP diphosphatase [Paramuribaculum sp.]|nr:non-canonical purine NTP diphosphatase [Bacteroides sp.]MDE6051239.1 non-canonical purine NTP diphosphatase [Paramuribaculum sp.]
MEKEIVFATNNLHKLSEIRRIMGDQWHILSLADINCNEDIPETADTLQGNAELKARFVKERYGYDCFADDTGLLVDALDGAPGVYSARYAGPGHDSAANMALLLENLRGVTDRKAHFSTVIALIQGEEMLTFEGRVDGTITETPSGTDGFGYDPIFRPDGHEETFAQMSADQKNAISHRGRATAQLIQHLSTP